MAIVQPGGSSSVGASAPIGSSTEWKSTVASIPGDYLPEFGQAISRTTYSVLFGILGTSWGPGDGSTTFNLPDCRNRVKAGADNDDTFRPTTNIVATCGPQNETCGGSESHCHNMQTCASSASNDGCTIEIQSGSGECVPHCQWEPTLNGYVDEVYIAPIPYVAVISIMKVL